MKVKILHVALLFLTLVLTTSYVSAQIQPRFRFNGFWVFMVVFWALYRGDPGT